jgi:Aspartyl protease
LRKNLAILIIAYCLLPIVYCNAQEILSQPQAKLLTRFPFKQYSGGVMVVQAKFANMPDSLSFILDTGSGGISLDSSTCAELNIATTATDTSITGIGGVRKVPFVFDQTLNFPGLEVRHLNFHVNNYEVLTSVYGERVDGIIGYSFFSRYIVAINFDSSYIEVYSPGKIRYPNEGTTLHPVFTALPIQWVNIKDKKKLGYNYYFDTGAGLCFLMSEQFATDSSILLSRRKPVLTQAQGMGGKLQMRLTVVKEVKIGPYRFRHVPTYLYDDQYNVTSFPFTGGLIGNDLLRRFNMVLNYPKREIHLTPNSRFTEGFDYAYTGLGIYYVDGKIMVEDVIEGSPAAKAKFMVGDEIFSVNNNFSHNIMAYKTILQNPNEDIKVIVQRKKELIILNVRTLSIR